MIGEDHNHGVGEMDHFDCCGDCSCCEEDFGVDDFDFDFGCVGCFNCFVGRVVEDWDHIGSVPP